MAAVRRAAACLQIQPLLSWDEAHTRGPRHYPVQLLRRNGASSAHCLAVYGGGAAIGGDGEHGNRCKNENADVNQAPYLFGQISGPPARTRSGNNVRTAPNGTLS
jgi:hypothetical protein